MAHMTGSNIVYVMLLAFVFGFGAAQSPSQAPAHPPANAPTAHRPIAHAPSHSVYPPAHAPSHSVYPPAHAPSPMTTPPAGTPSPVVYSIPSKSPVAAEPPSSISVPPSVAPAPAKNAAVFNRFYTSGSVAVGVLAAVLVV
ncbi:hypothetical protein REPUB_Repub04eG0097300 [Reevesia pubescens]